MCSRDLKHASTQDERDFKLLVIGSYCKYCTCAVEFYVGGRCMQASIPSEIRPDFWLKFKLSLHL